MTSRRVRIQKIAKLREKELERQAQRLAQAHAAVAAAHARADEEARKVELANLEREQLLSSDFSGDRWRDANEWLETRTIHHDEALSHLQRAHIVAERAQRAVLDARAALRRLEVLDERLAVSEARVLEQKERKLHDELAAQKAARGRGR
ncbi:MAG: hypothetical protein U0263_09845 [Polyangiaceae bacterium]